VVRHSESVKNAEHQGVGHEISLSLSLSLSLCACIFLSSAGAALQEEPFLVDVLVYDETTTPVKVIEIWSDRNHVIRWLAPNELPGFNCGPSQACSDTRSHCTALHSSGGEPCIKCSTGGSAPTHTYCWSVSKQVCQMVIDPPATEPTPVACGAVHDGNCNAIGQCAELQETEEQCLLYKCVPYGL
jgi:hypothetical protein